MKIKIAIGSIILLIGCVPPADESPSADVYLYQDLDECDDPCDVLLSFAATAVSSQNWRGSIDNYNKLWKCGCRETIEAPEEIYKYFGYSYRQLNLYDSAAYVFDQGLKYTPEDIELLNMASENAGKSDKVDDQIYYLDKIIIIEENNPSVLENLSDIYKEQEMYEDQINILNIWLKYDKSNKKANAEKKAAFSALGKDVSDVDRERWESEPSNIQYGMDYVKTLQNSGDNGRVVEICNEILIYDKYNKYILQYLAEAYQNLNIEENALDIYQTLAKVDPANFKIAIEISKIFVNQEKYQDALELANKAISISNGKGNAYYQRAEVYFVVAESCSGDPLQFWDKIVYEISWQDYQTAVNKGYKQAKSRRDFLGENFITTSADWFMRPEGEMEVKPQGDCYAWIDKSVRRRK